MKRSVREIIELAVFGLMALLIGTGLLWVAGWVLAGLGWLMQIVAGLLWSLLRFIVPVAIVAGLVFLLIRWVQQNARNRKPPKVEAVAAETAASSPDSVTAASGGTADSWHTPVVAAPQGEIVVEETQAASGPEAENVLTEAEAAGLQADVDVDDDVRVDASSEEDA